MSENTFLHFKPRCNTRVSESLSAACWSISRRTKINTSMKRRHGINNGIFVCAEKDTIPSNLRSAPDACLLTRQKALCSAQRRHPWFRVRHAIPKCEFQGKTKQMLMFIFFFFRDVDFTQDQNIQYLSCGSISKKRATLSVRAPLYPCRFYKCSVFYAT